KDREINRLKSTIDVLRRECQTDCSPTPYCESDSESRRKKLKEQKSFPLEKEEHSQGWFRGSISRAFKKNRSRHKSGGSMSDAEGCQSGTDCSSIPSTPLLSPRNPINSEIVEEHDLEAIRELKKQLIEKDKLLTDIRLEALSTSHQIENLKEAINKLRAETLLLREENQRLKRDQNRESIASSICSLTSFSDSSVFGGHDKLLIIYLNKIKLGIVNVSLSTSWSQVDSFVQQCFQEYLDKFDPLSTLEVNREIKSYSVGSKTRIMSASHTSESPLSWIAGNNELRVKLVDLSDEMSIHSLVPKPVFTKIIPLVKDKKRLVICGPQGCGKSFTAYSMAEYLVKTEHSDCKEDINSLIAIFTVKANRDDELKSFLTNIADSCESKQSPKVIILNDIENIGNVCDAFAPFKTVDCSSGPFVVATMRETSPVTTSLQLHFNFRVVVWTANMEPCKGFLSRCLRKKFFALEIESRSKKGVPIDRNLLKTLDWIAELCNRLNRSVHKNCVNNVNFAPNLFISCPINEKQSQEWFHNLWNSFILKHLKQLFANKNRSFEDLQKWIQETYPWKEKQILHTLFTINEEQQIDLEKDPLLKTLLKLKEAI
ncbi:Neuron navigator 2-like protein, partial [Leptotrombidium deliense]